MFPSVSPATSPPVQHARGKDLFLMIIVAGVGLLIILAFAIVLNRPMPTYEPEDAPAGVAYNYLLALQLGDYERAYGYLSPELAGYPANLASFVHDVKGNIWGLDTSVALEIESAVLSENQAAVTIQVTRFQRDGLFSGNESVEQTELLLTQTEDGWKLVEAGSYWFNCWHNPARCLRAP